MTPLLSRLPSVRAIPNLPSSSSSKKDRKPEDYLWNTLIRSVYCLPVDPSLYSQYARFTPLAGPGSDNWPLMAAATWLWSQPRLLIDGIDAEAWWEGFFFWQLGVDSPTAEPAPGDLGFFEMSEPRSNTYSGMICGSVLAVRLWALKHFHSALLHGSGQWLSKWALIHSLCALPGPLVSASVLTPSKSSSLPLPNRPINLPILTQDGSRSTPLHIIGDPRQLILAELLDYPSRSHPWTDKDPFEYWYLILCRMLKDAGDDFGLELRIRALCYAVMGDSWPHKEGDVESLSNLRWKPFSLYLFSDGSKLGILPSSVNGNTAPIHAGYIRRSPSGSGVESVSCWPWAKPKGQPVGSGKSEVVLTGEENEKGSLVVSSQLGSCPVVPLPSGPVTVLKFTETGLAIERI